MPTASNVSAGDTATAAQYNALVTDVTNNEKPAYKYWNVYINPTGLENEKSIVNVSALYYINSGFFYQSTGTAGATTGDYVNTRFEIGNALEAVTYGSDIDFNIEWLTSRVAQQDGFWGCAGFNEAAVVPAGHTSNTAHIGFFLDDNHLWASNASGAAQTATDLGVVSANINYTLRFNFDSGTDIKFYIDESSVATHSTNLPDNGDTCYGFFGLTTTENDHKIVYISNFPWYRTKQFGGA